MRRIFATLSLFFLSVNIAGACIHGTYSENGEESLKLIEQRHQVSVIKHENGTQHMYLSIDLKNPLSESGVENAVWIYPIPAIPTNIDLDIRDDIPELRGRNVQADFWNMLAKIPKDIVDYMFPVIISYWTDIGSMGNDLLMADLTLNIPEPVDVVVHESFTKMGIRTELLSTKNTTVFSSYLEERGLSFPPEMLEGYVGDEFSFVLSWIEDPKEVADSDKRLANFITFPTENIFFPLRFTSVYGETRVPITIYTKQWRTPVVYDSIREDISVEYRKGKVVDGNKEFFDFSSAKYSKEIRYTKIHLNTSSKNLISDLSIKEAYPKSLHIMEFFTPEWKNPLTLVFFVCISFLLGLIIFRKTDIPAWKYVSVSLFSILSIIGFWIALFFLQRNKGYAKEKMAFALLLPVIFLSIFVVMAMKFGAPFVQGGDVIQPPLFL